MYLASSHFMKLIMNMDHRLFLVIWFCSLSVVMFVLFLMMKNRAPI
jgi:hypothetical protein